MGWERGGGRGNGEETGRKWGGNGEEMGETGNGEEEEMVRRRRRER